MSGQVTNLEQLLREYQELPEFQGTALTSVNQQGVFKSTPLHIAIYRELPHEVVTGQLKSGHRRALQNRTL